MNNINDAMKKLQESRDRVAETLPKFIYDLDKDGAWSAREPSKTLGGKIFYKIDRNGSSSLSNDELIKAVLDKFPELKLYDGFRNDGDIITFIKKEVNESCDIHPDSKYHLLKYKLYQIYIILLANNLFYHIYTMCHNIHQILLK